MSLIDLWNTARDTIKDKQIQQVISFAGNGKLADGNETSTEFRTYLSYVPSDLLERYATECLVTSFDQSGFALQDVVNQIGRRLSFEVIEGSYRGRKGYIGFDGMWRSSTGNDIVVEVKTTDAYRIDLNTLASYRSNLVKAERISEHQSSILIVVGRQDTGDLEAQIRGSRHAWDIRLISVEALVRLMKLKETVEDPILVRKITTILTPQEFTKVDGIIDLVFSTAEEVSLGTTAITSQSNGKAIGIDQLGLDMPGNEIAETATTQDTEALVGTNGAIERAQQLLFHEQCVARIGKHLKTTLVKVSRSIYRTSDNNIILSCTISREYSRQNRVWYWFAFHPHQHEQLKTAPQAFAAFGCGTSDKIFLFPLAEFESWLEGLNQTVNDKRNYWHVHITLQGNKWILARKGGFSNIDVSNYVI